MGAVKELVVEHILSLRSLYLLIVLSGAFFLLVRGLVRIRKEEKRRLETVENRDYHQAVNPNEDASKSETPEDDSEDTENLTRRRAVQSIEARFEFIRRFYTPFILSITAILVCLPFLSTIPATYVSIVTALLAAVVGLAARPVIENAISGVVITLSQPIRINDTVIIDGHYGTIEKITLLYTVVKVWNWRRYVIPNDKMMKKELVNLTLGDELEWAHVEFRVSPDADLTLVKKIAKNAMVCRYLVRDEDPSFWVMDLEKDAISCWVAGWANDPAQAWALKSTARKNLVDELQRNGIGFQMANTNIQLKPEILRAMQSQQ
jgi:moderate conductance mechanosensitive channel